MRSLSLQSKMSDNKLLDFCRFRGVQNVDNIDKFYQWKRVLGAGSFGQVHEAKNLKANFNCAVKILQKRKVCRNQTDKMLVRNELSALQLLDHPHIVHVIELLSDNQSFYCVMELMKHGNLMDHLERLVQQQKTLSERDAA